MLVASFIYQNNPQQHIDIDSREDGFVVHVASFEEIEVMDVRKLSDTLHKNIVFIKADLMKANAQQINVADSISCLHEIKHFGLVRYGDPIVPNGYKKGYKKKLFIC